MNMNLDRELDLYAHLSVRWQMRTFVKFPDLPHIKVVKSQ